MAKSILGIHHVTAIAGDPDPNRDFDTRLLGLRLVKVTHNQSSRRQGPFVALNCAGIPGPLLESELFGHERGAFTGACAQTKGRFQVAGRGTLFLDEIGDLPLELQPKHLRALQEQEFERLGSSQTMVFAPESVVRLRLADPKRMTKQPSTGASRNFGRRGAGAHFQEAQKQNGLRD